jgi:hypothetical protein
MRWVMGILGVCALIITGGIYLSGGNNQWGPGSAGLLNRLKNSGLQVLTSEGTVLHIHQHLDIFINGKSMAIPAEIGIDTTSGILSPIHTHDATGIIHVESPVVKNFTLGEFFNGVWGVRLTDSCIGDYCATGDKKLEVYSNGKKLDSGYGNLILADKQEITIFYGTDAQRPTIPGNYIFPAGY